MLEVTFSLWFTCNCRNMSPWIREEFSLSPGKSSRIGHAGADILEMVACYLHFNEKFLYAHQATDWCFSRKRITSSTSLSSFTFSQQGLGCVSLQEAPAVAIVFWQSQSYLYFWSLTQLTHILRIQQHYLPDIHQNYLFRHTKSTVWFHLSRAESQAAMMVGVPQGFHIGLLVTPTRLILWLTHLTGRPIAIIPWFLKNNHSPWGFCVTYSRSCPLWSLLNPKFLPLLNELKACHKLDIGI
jgi:hypothetical protein